MRERLPSPDPEDAYRRYGPAVYRRARELLGDDGEARELVQELFLELIASPKQFGGKSSLPTFLYSATTHRCLNRLRDDRTRRRLIGEATQLAAVCESGRSEAVAQLRQILARAPRDLAEAAAYVFLDGMTHEETARLLGCSRRHVGDLLVRFQSWLELQEDNS